MFLSNLYNTILHYFVFSCVSFLQILRFDKVKIKQMIIVLTGEKKKTKAIDNELNPVWNEVSTAFQFIVGCDGIYLFIGK